MITVETLAAFGSGFVTCLLCMLAVAWKRGRDLGMW